MSNDEKHQKSPQDAAETVREKMFKSNRMEMEKQAELEKQLDEKIA
jgi:hypothetical protein